MEDDPDENLMEVEDQSSMNLFTDAPAGGTSDAAVSGDSQSAFGKYAFTAWGFHFSAWIGHCRRPCTYQLYAHFIFRDVVC